MFDSIPKSYITGTFKVLKIVFTDLKKKVYFDTQESNIKYS